MSAYSLVRFHAGSFGALEYQTRASVVVVVGEMRVEYLLITSTVAWNLWHGANQERVLFRMGRNLRVKKVAVNTAPEVIEK